MKRLSANNDGVCDWCGRPAAEGLSDDKGLWCRLHGRIRAVQHFERAAFDLRNTYPGELPQAFAGVLRHRQGQFDLVSDDLARLETAERTFDDTRT